MNWTIATLGIAALAASACSPEEGTSTADVQQAAKERVRQELGLVPDAALFTDVFVGRERDGDAVVCGTVGGRRTDGTALPARRFIAATDPSRWLAFDSPDPRQRTTANDMFPEWEQLCAGARGDNGDAPPAAPPAAEDS